MRIWKWLPFILFSLSSVARAQLGSITGFCTAGTAQAVTQGMKSTNSLQGVVPRCLVTVYATGTTDLATIYADKNSTPLTNPFTASNIGQWLFYASAGQNFDIVLSGGIPPNVFPAPVTLTDVVAGSGGMIIGTAFHYSITPQGSTNAVIASALYASSTAYADLTVPNFINTARLLGNSTGGGAVSSALSGSVSSAITAAAASSSGVSDDLCVFGGFANSQNVDVDFPCDINHAHAGMVFPEQWGAFGNGTTDDHVAVQSCWNYAASNNLACEMHPKTSYLITSGLTMPSGYNIRGTSPQQGTTIKSEVNGDAITLAAGPIVGGRLSNFHLACDSNLSNSRGFHIQGSIGGGFNAGGMWNSIWDNVEIDNCSNEGYYSQAGGNAAGGLLPNQFDTFINLTVNGPLQSHPKNLILLVGETIQNTFINGSTQVPNITDFTQYPNPLVELMNATTGLNDGPTNITFLGYAAQEGSVCFDATQSFSISFTHGYFERCVNAATSTATDNLIIQNNNVQNSGTTTAAFIFNGGVIGKLDDSFIENGGGFPLVQFATCSNANFIEMSGNYSSSNIITTSCDTSIISVPSSGPLVVQTYDTLVNTSSTPIQNITYRQNAGERLTLFAAGGPITLESGGNINLGGYANPLVIPSGTIVTLKLIDFPANIWIVESTNGAQQPQTGIFQTLGGSFPSQWQQISSTNSGLTNGIPAGDNCFISSISNGTGTNVNEIASCHENGSFGVGETEIIYGSHNTAAASPVFSIGHFVAASAAFTVSTLPSASAYTNTIFVVTDSSTFTPGACSGGGTDTMLAVSNGTSWTCH